MLSRLSALVLYVAILVVVSVSPGFAQLPQIALGLSYLNSSQNADGTWGNGASFVETAAVTASALEAFKILNQTTGSSYTNATAWLQGQSPNTVDYLSQRIHAIGLADSSIDTLISQLNQLKQAWGGDDGYVTDNIDTARALQALKVANYSDQSLIFYAINYLLSTQNSDGGWGFIQGISSDSTVYITSQVLNSLAQYKTTYLMDQQLSNAASFLLSKQNPDGGFGSSSSTVYETALAFIALIESGQTQGLPLQNAINYLTTTQSANGSWNYDPYSTALALRALSYVKSDLSILPANIAVLPATPNVNGSITVTATVANSGLDTANNITVRLLDNGAAVGEQTIASIAPGGTGQAVFAISPLTPTGEHILTIAVDPANSIDEISKTNNSATTRIWAKAPADLVVTTDFLTLTPAYPKPGEAVTLDFAVANMGESAAGSFTAILYDGDPKAGGTQLGTATLPGIAAGTWGEGSITFSFAAAGIHTLYLVADPQNAATELSETNNTAQKSVTVNATSGTGIIDLTIPTNGLQLTPQRPRSGDTVTVTLLAGNLGTEPTTADLELFDGDPAAGGILLHKTALTLNAGESRSVTVPWQIPAGIHSLRAYIDRTNVIVERDETNNNQALTVMADMVDIEVSASDILVEPEHPLDGDPATVKVTIQNRGIVPTGPFTAKLYNGDPDNGGTLLQSFAIADLAGDATQEIDYPFTAARGTYRFYVVCDPENGVTELFETNNLAIRSLLVKTSAEAKGPDLVPLEFDLSGAATDPQSLRISGTAKVWFQNKGDDKIITPFRITVFEDKDNDGIYTESADLALGFWNYSAPMNPNMAGLVTINLAGTVTFRDAPIYAMLDSGQVVFEQNKYNNSIRKGSACEARPANTIEPVLKWQWRGGKTACYALTIGPPAVIGLTDDNGDGKIDDKDTPSILFTTKSKEYCPYHPSYLSGGGILKALNGKTGQELLSFTDPAHPFLDGELVVAGDINNDGRPEILLQNYKGGMLNISNDGKLLWDNTQIKNDWSSTHGTHTVDLGQRRVHKLADLDGNGIPKIISGATVLNSDGSVQSARDSALGTGYGGSFGASAVADLYLEGKQNIIAGNTAYNADGTVKWFNWALPDGMSLIANFDDDPYPEIVLASTSLGATLYLLEHDGSVKWGPVNLASLEGVSPYGNGSVPTIADFDGDGQLEIGVKGNNNYFILDRDGRIKQTIPIPMIDNTPWRVAATVFDLNGDGRPEIIIYSDQYLRIYDGKTGSLLSEDHAGLTHDEYLSHPPRYQGVIVADVDGDGHAELVVTGQDNNWYDAEHWVKVYGAKNNDWQNTRRVWNQAGYHVTNVNDDGTIPRYEAPSWLTNNSYHCNVPTTPGPNPYLASDLSTSFVRVDMANYPVSVVITARIGNGGAKTVPAGVHTTFFDGDPANGGVLIGSALTTKTLNPGDFEDVSSVWNSPSEGNHTIVVTADADNSQSECDRTNNSVSQAVYITSGKPDPSVAADDIVAPATIPEGSLTSILVTVRNLGALQADNVLVRLYAGNPASGGKQIGSDQIISAIAAGSAATLKTTWNTLGAAGVSYLYAVVDPAATTADANRGNNITNRQIVVTAAVKPDLQIGVEDITITPVFPLEGDTLNITATVHNRGSQTGSIKVVLYDGSPTAGGIKRAETVIPQMIPQGGSATSTFTLDTIGLSGSHALYLRIDPDNTVDEADETNNQASRSVTIAAAGLTMSIATDKNAYSANENVQSTVSLAELNGTARTLFYDLLILDSKGVQTALLPETALSLGANASRNFTIPWNSGVTYAGSYTIMVRIKENSRIIAKATTAISITPVKTADAKIVVDKAAYRANEQVAISATITGTSPNYSGLTAKTSVLGGRQVLLMTSSRTIPSLANGQRVEMKNYWNTGTLVPGTYAVVIEIEDNAGELVATGTQDIVISSAVVPSVALSGTVSVDKQSLLSGETVNVSFNLTNRGNMDLPNVALSVLTVHVANQTVYNTLVYQTELPMGVSYAATGQIDTTNFTAKDYLVVLRATINDVEETLAGTYFRVEGAPSAPALSAPANGVDVDTFTPRLSVGNAADPNDDKLGYEFEIYSDSGLTQLVSTGSVPETTGTTAWTVPAPLAENQTCYWRARAYDGRLYGPWMTPATFRINTVNDPPTAPTVSNPADGTSVASLTPTLTVANASDPDSANLINNFDLALDPEFTRIVASTRGVASGPGTTSWTVPTNLQENGWYYWRAQADDWLMEGPWSAAARFLVNTANDAPTAPAVAAPSSGATVAALATDVVVTNSSDPDSSSLLYFFEVDTAPTFDSADIIRSGSVAEGSGTTLWHLGGLRDNSRYYLRVKASDGSADSLWSNVSGFIANTVNDPPTTPTLANPSDGAGVSLFTPTLSVHNATDPDGDNLTYEFELYADAALTNLVSQSGAIAETSPVTGWAVPVTLAENQTCYWRARAGDGPLRSGWMPTASFMVNTANDAPGVPQISAPGDGTSIATLTPTLEVLNAVDSDSTGLTYDFEVYGNNQPAASVSGVPGGTSGKTSATLNNALADNMSYSWRVRAFDGDRYGQWMSMATFKTHVAVNIRGEIRFEPETLNKKSVGNWVMVQIELPPGYRAADVDLSSLRLEGTVPAEASPISINQRGNADVLTVRFLRSAAIALLPAGDNVPVHVTGKVGSSLFEGVDIIRVIK